MYLSLELKLKIKLKSLLDLPRDRGLRVACKLALKATRRALVGLCVVQLHQYLWLHLWQLCEPWITATIRHWQAVINEDGGSRFMNLATSHEQVLDPNNYGVIKLIFLPTPQLMHWSMSIPCVSSKRTEKVVVFLIFIYKGRLTTK